mmetsp:Transcript_112116/g.289690  ORF Transcript_112116/g.289690 Transcript_112116/m.289690 type:complete len:279 (-) Transcript_112116:35-871(-)
MPTSDVPTAAPVGSPHRRRRQMLSAAIAAFAAMSASQAFCQFAFVGGAAPLMPALRPGVMAPFAASSLPRRADDDGEEVDPEEAERREQLRAQRAADRAWRTGLNLDGDNLDNLQEWYEEALAGPGGMPKDQGQQAFFLDLILRSFFGEMKKGWIVDNMAKRAYTGENNQPCNTDFETAWENFKRNVKEGVYVGRDDGQGWTWLVASQSPGGLELYLAREPPFGERPLALIKTSDPDEFFDKVDWNRLFIRLHKPQLWGGTVSRFPIPLGKQRQFSLR